MPDKTMAISALCLFLFSFGCHSKQETNNQYEDGISLTITNKPFKASDHKITYCEQNKPCAIDGKIFYGGNGETPKTEVSSLIFSKNGKEIHLDVSSMYDSGITNSNIKEYISVEPYMINGAYMVVGYFGWDKKRRIPPYVAHWLVLTPSDSVRNHLGDYESLTGLVYKVKRDLKISQ